MACATPWPTASRSTSSFTPEDKKGKVADNKGSIELKPGQFKGGGIFLGDERLDLGRCDSDAPLVRWQLRGIASPI